MKTILGSLLGTTSDERVLEASYRLAGLFGSHIDALHVRPDPAQLISTSGAALDAGISMAAFSGEMWESLLAANKNIARRAHRHFQKFVEAHGLKTGDEPGTPEQISAKWREIEGEYTRAVTSATRFHDVAVLAASGEEGELLPELGSILTSCGRPLFVVPRHVHEDISSTIAIAWKETAEAARAVTAAMPLLRVARRVLVLSVSEDEDATEAETSAKRLAEQLQWHGFKVAAHHVPADNLRPEEALMDVAKDVGAKLLVMGGYGHSRAFEFVFGGFTRFALAHAPIPVLMAH